MAMIGKDGNFHITPFIDDGRRDAPDLTQPTPANRWRFPAEPQLYHLYRAVWRLKADAPASLLRLKDDLLASLEADPQKQADALAEYQRQIASVIEDIKASAASQQVKDQVDTELRL